MSLDAILDSAAREALAVGAFSVRLVPVAAICPFLGGPLLPPAARAALALSLGAVARAVAGGSLPPGATALGLVASELVIGAVVATVASLPVEAVRGAGRLVDTIRGATLGELHVAPIRQRETATGDLLAFWTVALGTGSGADRLLVGALLETYRAVPVGAALDAPLRAGRALEAASALLSAAVALGAPAAAAVLCADLALAAASRVAPRLGLLDAAAPARASLGVAAVALAAFALGERLVEIAATSPALVRAIAGGSP